MTEFIRVLLLRLIIGWWAIPMVWIVMWPIGWLIGGTNDATENSMYLTHLFWYGELP